MKFTRNVARVDSFCPGPAGITTTRLPSGITSKVSICLSDQTSTEPATKESPFDD